MKVPVIVATLLFCCYISFAQIPYIQNYSPDVYKGATQNWDLIEDSKGVLYFANSDGILKFNGVTWNIIRLPEISHIFSLKINEKGWIYVGANNAIGYLKENKSGTKEYVSLTEKIPSESRSFGRVYKIFLQNSKVIFISNKLFMIYDEKTNTLKKINREKTYQFEFDQQILFKKDKEIYQLGKDKLTTFQFSDSLRDKVIVKGYTLDKNHYLIATLRKGIFMYDTATNQSIPLNADLNKFLKNKRLNIIKKISQERFVITGQNIGLLVIDQQGNILNRISQDNEVFINTIHNLLEDKHHNLWLANNFGITQIALSSPLSLLDQNDDWGGNILALTSRGENTYVGTNKGLFYKQGNTFKLIENTKGEVWSFKTIHHKLYMAHGRGVFMLDGTNAHKIIGHHFVHALGTLQQYPEVVLFGTYNSGLWVLKKTEGQWTKTKVKGFDKEIRYIVEDEQENIWISSYESGFYKLKLNKSLDAVKEIKYYTQREGLPSDKNNRVFKLNNGKVLFTTLQGIYQYNPQRDVFEPNKAFQKNIGNTRCIYSLTENKKGDIYFWTGISSPETIEYGGVLKLQTNQSYKLYDTPFYKIKKELNSLNSDIDAPITVLDDGSVFIGNITKLIHYNPAIKINYDQPYKTLINKVFANDSLIAKGIGKLHKTLPYRLNSLKFEYSSLFYEDHEKNTYQFKLEGFNKEWAEWSSQPNTLFTNLSEGDYIFRVRAKNIYGKISKEATFYFSIAPPASRTWWAYTLYGAFAILLIIVIVRLNSRRLLKQKENLEQKILERTIELREKQMEIINQNKELQKSQEEVLMQNEELQQNQEEITAQRDFIEEKNKKLENQSKQIHSSIRAAQTIQKAILPYQAKLDSLLQDYFIIYKPKDVVSGDFYWLNHIENKTILIVADCTGHGVPGAFMTLIGNTLLDKIVRVWKITEPAKILDRLHEEVTTVLKQDHTGSNNGMDLLVVSLEKTGNETTKIIFSGAKNSMYYINGGTTETHQLKGDRRSIGGLQNKHIPFTNQEIILPKDSLIHLSTDGLQDQNDVSRKRFSKQKLRKVLEACSPEPLEIQQKIIEEELSTYMKGTTQRDDILLIGVKL